MIGMFVGDQDCVKLIDAFTYGRKTGQRFAFSKSGVNEDAGAFAFKQR
jgi:hypothetical protein